MLCGVGGIPMPCDTPRDGMLGMLCPANWLGGPVTCARRGRPGADGVCGRMYAVPSGPIREGSMPRFAIGGCPIPRPVRGDGGGGIVLGGGPFGGPRGGGGTDACGGGAIGAWFGKGAAMAAAAAGAGERLGGITDVGTSFQPPWARLSAGGGGTDAVSGSTLAAPEGGALIIAGGGGGAWIELAL